MTRFNRAAAFITLGMSITFLCTSPLSLRWLWLTLRPFVGDAYVEAFSATFALTVLLVLWGAIYLAASQGDRLISGREATQ